jgi:hypothetical protein
MAEASAAAIYPVSASFTSLTQLVRHCRTNLNLDSLISTSEATSHTCGVAISFSDGGEVQGDPMVFSAKRRPHGRRHYPDITLPKLLSYHSSTA